jgi:hypothetical protein
MPNFFGDLPQPSDIMAKGKQTAWDVLGNNGLVVRKGIGTVLRIADSLSPIGTKSRDENTFNPQRDFIFDFIFSPTSSTTSDAIKEDVVSKYCQEVKFSPFRLASTDSLKYGASKRSYPGFVTFDNLHLTFICPTPDTVGPYLRKWFRTMISADGFYSPKAQFVRSGTLTLYARDGAPSFGFKLSGLFPIKIGEYNLSWNNKEYLKYSVELNVDYIEVLKLNKDNSKQVEAEEPRSVLSQINKFMREI